MTLKSAGAITLTKQNKFQSSRIYLVLTSVKAVCSGRSVGSVSETCFRARYSRNTRRVYWYASRIVRRETVTKLSCSPCTFRSHISVELDSAGGFDSGAVGLVDWETAHPTLTLWPASGLSEAPYRSPIVCYCLVSEALYRSPIVCCCLDSLPSLFRA